MSKRVVTLLLAGLVVAAPALAQTRMGSDTVMVGGAAMYPSKNIVENAVNSKDHTTLVAAVKAGRPGRGYRRQCAASAQLRPVPMDTSSGTVIVNAPHMADLTSLVSWSSSPGATSMSSSS